MLTVAWQDFIDTLTECTKKQVMSKEEILVYTLYDHECHE